MIGYGELRVPSLLFRDGKLCEKRSKPMKKWIARLSLILALAGTTAAAFDVYFRIANSAAPESVFQKVNQGILVFLAGIVVICVWILIQTFREKTSPKWLPQIFQNRRLYWMTAMLLGLILVESIQDLFYLGANLNETFYPVILRENRTLLVWIGAVSGQALASWLVLGWLDGRIRLSGTKDISLWILIGLGVGYFFVFTGRGGSLPANAPIPFLHFLAVGSVVMAGAVLGDYLGKRSAWFAKILSADILAFFVLWIAAFFLWSNVPLESNYFIDHPRPPNQEFTPISDSIFYESQAHRFLVGEGFGEESQHPFYSFLLSGLHLLGGDHYLDIYRLQIAILAVTPYFLYQLGKLLGSRFTGWVVAGLFLVREYNALQLGDTITVSNVQVLMTEPLATLGVVIILYLIIRWLKTAPSSKGMPVIIGAVIGVTALIRVELLTWVFLFLIITLLTFWRSWKKWVGAAVLMLAALMLVLTPWMIRNYQVTGSFSVDKGRLLERTFQNYFGRGTGSDGEWEDPELQARGNLVERGLLKIRRSWGHIRSSLQQTILYLPSNYFPLGGMDHFVKVVPEKRQVRLFQHGIFSDRYLTRYTKSLPYWHVRWKGEIALRSILPLGIVIAVISLGILQSWKSNRWLGLLPLSALIIHVVVYSLFSGSGGRYIQVVDWVTLLYLCLGVQQAVSQSGLIEIDTRQPGSSQPVSAGKAPFIEGRTPTKATSNWSGLWIGLLLILVGISMPVLELIIPPQYTAQAMNDRLKSLEQDELIILQSDVKNPADRATSLIRVYGKALYPGFYENDEEILDDRQGRVPPAKKYRMVFYIVGMENIWVSFRTQKPPEYFPHGTEVVIEGVYIRDSEEDLANGLLPYMVVNRVTILDR